MSESEASGTSMFLRRMVVIAFAAMVTLLGAREFQRRTVAKHKGVTASNVTAVLRGDVDFTKQNLAQEVEQKASLRRDSSDEPKKSAKETVRGWINELLK